MHDLGCICGRHFRRPLYHAVDVRQQPGLRYAILAGVLNVVQCPSCERIARVDIPLLFQDAQGGRLLYVYPTPDALPIDQAGGGIARLAATSDDGVEDAPRADMVFGLERLAETVADGLGRDERPGSITIDVRPGIRPERAGRIMANRVAIQIGGYVHSWREGGRLHLQILGPRALMEQITISIG